MPGYTLNQWVDRCSSEEICKSEGYTVIKAREILKEIGYDIKELKVKYQFSDRVLSELFAYLPETKQDLYYNVGNVVESIISEVKELLDKDPVQKLPSYNCRSPRSVYIWRYGGGRSTTKDINKFRCYTISSKILRDILRSKCGKLVIHKNNEPGRIIDLI